MKGPNAAVLFLSCLSGNVLAAPTGTTTAVDSRSNALSQDGQVHERNAPPTKFVSSLETREIAVEQQEEEFKVVQKMLTERPDLVQALQKLPVVGTLVQEILTSDLQKRDDMKFNVSDDEIKSLHRMVTGIPILGALLSRIPIIGPLLNKLLGGLLGNPAGGLSSLLGGLTGGLTGASGTKGTGTVGGVVGALTPVTSAVNGLTGGLTSGLTNSLLGKGGIADLLTGLLGNTLKGATSTVGAVTSGLTNGLADATKNTPLGGLTSTLGNTVNGATGTVGALTSGLTNGLTSTLTGKTKRDETLVKRVEVSVNSDDVEVLKKYAELLPILGNLPIIGPLLRSLGL